MFGKTKRLEKKVAELEKKVAELEEVVMKLQENKSIGENDKGTNTLSTKEEEISYKQMLDEWLNGGKA